MTGPAGCGGGCGCGPFAAGVPQPGAFTRPRFFAGQLLCEEDLESLVTYTTGKERLHNRYLVGTGVVGGLDVACLPNRPGSVLVRAGYALDCCGNDIVVPCDQTVDVNALIAELAGDSSCASPATPSTSSAMTFELVVEYAETPTALLSPYSTPETSAGACEPSRVQEGYRLSLRCPPEPTTAPTLITALQCCLQLADGSDKQLARLERASELIGVMAAGPAGPDPDPPKDEEVEAANKQFTDDGTLDSGVHLAALCAAKALAEAVTPTSDGTKLAQTGFAAVAGGKDDLLKAAGDDPLAAARARTLIDESADLSVKLGKPFTPSSDDRLLAREILAGDQLRAAIRQVVADTREWTVCSGQADPAHHCGALRDSSAFSVLPDDDPGLKVSVDAALLKVRQAIVDCCCSAINPPLPDCTDLAVPLATLAVSGCDVTDICIAVRRYPLTGTALRYWLPIDLLYDRLEKLCCGTEDPGRLVAILRERLSGWLRELSMNLGTGWDRASELAERERSVEAREAELNAREALLPDAKQVNRLRGQFLDLSKRVKALEKP